MITRRGFVRRMAAAALASGLLTSELLDRRRRIHPPDVARTVRPTSMVTVDARDWSVRFRTDRPVEVGDLVHLEANVGGLTLRPPEPVVGRIVEYDPRTGDARVVAAPWTDTEGT